ncbi:hypothetical protein [Burkholderia phage vB_BglM_WTB]
MILTKEFEMFGVKYETREFAAIPALAMLRNLETVHPTILLARTDVIVGNAKLPLSNPNTVNSYVLDRAGILSPRAVLDGLMGIVSNHSFGFLDLWRGVRIPGRFLSEVRSERTENADPMIAQLINEKVATLRELEEYYSLRDAFVMSDILVTSAVNAALQREAAEREAKNRR